MHKCIHNTNRSLASKMDVGDLKPFNCLICQKLSGVFDEEGRSLPTSPSLVFQDVPQEEEDGGGPPPLNTSMEVKRKPTFKRALTLFCELTDIALLESNENRRDLDADMSDKLQKYLLGGHGVEQGFTVQDDPFPCCSDCNKRFAEILELEQIITQCRKSQLEHAAILKLNLLNSAVHAAFLQQPDDTSFWAQIRSILVDRLHTRTREGERVGSVEVPLRTTRSSKGPEDIISFKEMLSQTVAIASNPVKMEGVQSGNPCSAILHNNKMGSSNASRIPTDPSTLSSKRNMVSASNDEVLQTRKRRRAQCRDSASEAEPGSWKIAQEVCERVADDKPHNFAQSDSDNYQSSNEESWNEAVLDSCDTNADVDSRKHRKSALKPKEVKEPGRLKQGSTTALPRAPPVGKKKANLNYIILVKEDTLIFKFTTIKIEKTPGYWICKEKGCQTILEGNDSTLFQEMRAHVNEKHATSVAYKSKSRKCPLCPQICRRGLGFRHHITRHHRRYARYICEICLKPVSLQSLAFQRHLWQHKNGAEKAAALESGETDPFETKKQRQHEIFCCNECDKRFNYKHVLERHKEVHQRHRQKLKQKSLEFQTNSVLKLEEDMESQLNDNHCQEDGNSSKKIKNRHNIIVLNDDLLMLMYTTIKRCGSYLQCLEEGCGVTFPGQDYFTLQKIRTHIAQVHQWFSKSYIAKARTCHLCNSHTSAGRQLRTHLSREHTYRNLCESCWKPTYKETIALLKHAWRHKSNEEKAAAFAAEMVTFPISPAEKKYVTAHAHLYNIRCEECGEMFRTQEDLEYHVCTHHTVADDEIETKYEMQANGRRAHLDYFMKVGENTVIFLFTLIKMSEGKGSLICLEDRCGEIIQGWDYDSFQKIKGHIQDTHSNTKNYAGKPRRCPLCQMNCQSGRLLRGHLNQFHKACFFCECCWKPVKQRMGSTEMRNHMFSHKSGEEKALAVKSENTPKFFKSQTTTASGIQCEQCGKLCASEKLLEKHKQIHLPRDQRRSFMCSDCGLKVLSRVALKSHIGRAHRPDPAQYIYCEICRRQFHKRDKGTLKVHMGQHTQERPFVCDHCGKGFVVQHLLTSHIKMHHTDFIPEGVECEVCHKTFMDRKTMIKHKMRIHGVKIPRDPRITRVHVRDECVPDFIGPKIMYPCEICGNKYFKTKWQLNAHLKSSHSSDPARFYDY